jgi:Lrp/AsnC family transcriptional regulator
MDAGDALRNNVSPRGTKPQECCVDRLDRKILELLQKDGALTAAEIADQVGLTKAPCWRRIRNLQETGVIRQTVAVLDAKSLNVGTTVFVTVKAANHTAAWFERFARVVADIPEVVDLYRMSGDVDYLMRVCVPDIETYDEVYKKLIANCDFLDVSASFALETIKSTTALPLNYAKFD